ncbi:hypothetical protein EV401DRAFT_885242 [Pisolithus croceorrhizus]|nr:hypothetical protein EV401DRAFT_885242 [Pisolithus croceorrhizus]
MKRTSNLEASIISLSGAHSGEIVSCRGSTQQDRTLLHVRRMGTSRSGRLTSEHELWSTVEPPSSAHFGPAVVTIFAGPLHSRRRPHPEYGERYHRPRCRLTHMNTGVPKWTIRTYTTMTNFKCKTSYEELKHCRKQWGQGRQSLRLYYMLTQNSRCLYVTITSKQMLDTEVKCSSPFTIEIINSHCSHQFDFLKAETVVFDACSKCISSGSSDLQCAMGAKDLDLFRYAGRGLYITSNGQV